MAVTVASWQLAASQARGCRDQQTSAHAEKDRSAIKPRLYPRHRNFAKARAPLDSSAQDHTAARVHWASCVPDSESKARPAALVAERCRVAVAVAGRAAPHLSPRRCWASGADRQGGPRYHDACRARDGEGSKPHASADALRAHQQPAVGCGYMMATA